MSKLSGKHDEFFKHWMSDITIARDYIRQFLPEHVVNKLDLESLRLEDFSFVDENLKSAFADLVTPAS